MGCVASIPERVYGLRQIEEGASLLERRRKFQSLKGVDINLEIWTPIDRITIIPDMSNKVFRLSSDPDLVGSCYNYYGWCQSSSAATEIRSGQYVPCTVTSIRHTRSFSSLKPSTAIRKTLWRLKQWLIMINLLSLIWKPIHRSAIPQMLIRLLRLQFFLCRLSTNSSNLTFSQNRLNNFPIKI